MQSALSFSFQVAELTQQLRQSFQETLSGYWQVQLHNSNESNPATLWHIAITQGQICFSDTEPLSCESFLKTLQRYIRRLRNPQSQETIQQLQQNASSTERAALGEMLNQMEKMELLSHDEALQAMRLKILSDLDTYLFDYAGEAKFIHDQELNHQTPIRGFESHDLLLTAIKRRVQWNQLHKHFPSSESILSFNPKTLNSPHIPPKKKQQLQNLLRQGKSLDAIAYDMGRDRLEAARTFALLIEKGLVTVAQPETGVMTDSQGSGPPKILIVDDSPVFVQQFDRLLESWGYRVSYCNDPLTAIPVIFKSQPTVIFLDLNMPGASGFDLIKQIRREPKLASIPLVLLTSETTAVNQWRAQWANCKFLAKACKREEIPTFREELRILLRTTAPLATDILV